MLGQLDRIPGVSPGFESNDLGFMGSADRAGAHAVVHWRDVVPDQVTRDKSAWVAKWYTWNFNGDRQSDGVQANGNVTLLNYFNLGGGASTSRATQDDRLTRGGPSAISPRGYGAYANFGTDERKPFAVGVHPGFSWNDEGNRSRGFSLWFTFKPSSRLTLSTGPQINRSRTIAQYVTSVADPTATETFGGRYVFGSLEQTHMTLTTRVSINLSPQVSIRLYAQPLLASGNYAGFKELAAPRTFAFTEYGGASSLVFDSTRQHYTIDPDGDGPASSFDFADPDFNLKSLRVNAVFRWEIKPGSTFYGVWTRQQQDTRFPGDFRASRDVSLMFSAPGDDVFLVKMAYWIGR